jgi:hypothetical protein
MATIRTSVPSRAPRDVLWSIVRNLSERTAFLPEEGFRDVVGDADHATFKVRVAKGWTDAESTVVRVVEGQEVEEQAQGDGIRYTASFRLSDDALAAELDYQLAGVPGLLERTVLRPIFQRYFTAGVEGIVAEAERRAGITGSP